MSKLAFDFVVVGNGAIGNAIALALSEQGTSNRVALVGPRERPGCASLAAGAMLNVFAELEKGALDHPASRKKFDAAVKAANMWPQTVETINSKIKKASAVKIEFGTQLVSNAAATDLDDVNFKAIVDYMDEYNEPYREIDPTEIEGIAPEPQARPLKAVLLEREGTISSKALHRAYDELFASQKNIQLFDELVASISVKGSDKVIQTKSGNTLTAPHVVLASGVEVHNLISQLEIAKKIQPMFYGVGTSIILKSQTEVPTKVFRTPNRGLACGIYVVPYADNYCYIGATNFICPWPVPQPRVTSVHVLLEAAMEQVNQSFYKAYMHKTIIGYRPTPLDTFPLIGETSIAGLWLATGTKRDGFHMSPAIADAIKDAIFSEKAPFENVFSPERKLIFTMSREASINKCIDHMLSAGYQHKLRLPKANWTPMMLDAFRKSVEDVYVAAGLKDPNKGIPPEMLDMYRYGHARHSVENLLN